MSRPRLIVGGLLILVGGGFVLWLQVGLLGALGALAKGGLGLQENLTTAATGVQDGDFAGAEVAFREATTSSGSLAASAASTQLDLVARMPGLTVAIDNWRHVASAATDLTHGTGELLSLYGDLSGKGGGQKIFHDGAIDLARLNDLPQRVDTTGTLLDQAEVSLQAVSATTPFANPLARVQAKALEQMKPVQSALGSLEEIAPVLPDALGANGVRRYLVAIGNQAEMRASGGAPLTLILVEFNKGRISIPIKGPTSTQLFPPVNAPVVWFGPQANPFFAKNPRNAPFVVSDTHPNMLFSAREMAGAWVGGGYPEVDGVITLDLTAIAAALDATGPIDSPVYGQVTGDKLGQILLVDAYAQFGQEGADERQQANQDLLNALLDRLLSGNDLLPAAQAIASTAPGRHVQFWMRNEQLESLAISSGSAGIVDDPSTAGDWSAMYTQNGNQSKVDVFQQRNVLITVQLQDDGSARVTQQLTLTNATPPDRPAEGTFGRIGYETTWLKAAYLMYVPDEAQGYQASYPTGFAVRPFANHPQLGRGWVDDGFGHKLIRVVGWTPPGGQTALSVSYTLPAGTFSTSDGTLAYTLQAEPQSLWQPSTLTVQVTAPNGYTPRPLAGMAASGSTATVSAVQSAPIDVRLEFAR